MVSDPDVSPGSGIRLLLVSPDEKDRLRLRNGLRGRFAVVEAATAEEALYWLDARYFSVILTDYELGDQTGTWLLQETARRRPHVHRFLMSARGVPDIFRLRAEEVFRVFMAKPVEPEVFSEYCDSQYARDQEPMKS
jgi:DNA-binding NtrC family response regulator